MAELARERILKILAQYHRVTPEQETHPGGRALGLHDMLHEEILILEELLGSDEEIVKFLMEELSGREDGS